MLKDKIFGDMQKSLKEKSPVELKVLRFVLSLIKYAEIDKQKDLTDEEVVNLLMKEAKKRKEAVVLFQKGNREDLVKDENAQIKIIEKYLPERMSEEELDKIIEGVIVSFSPPFDMGQIMKAVMPKVKGRIDGAVVSSKVREKIKETSG